MFYAITSLLGDTHLKAVCGTSPLVRWHPDVLCSGDAGGTEPSLVPVSTAAAGGNLAAFTGHLLAGRNTPTSMEKSKYSLSFVKATSLLELQLWKQTGRLRKYCQALLYTLRTLVHQDHFPHRQQQLAFCARRDAPPVLECSVDWGCSAGALLGTRMLCQAP